MSKDSAWLTTNVAAERYGFPSRRQFIDACYNGISTDRTGDSQGRGDLMGERHPFTADARSRKVTLTVMTNFADRGCRPQTVASAGCARRNVDGARP